MPSLTNKTVLADASTLFSEDISFCSNMEEELLMLVTVVLICANRISLKRLKRTQWSRKWLLKRRKFSNVNLIRELRSDPPDWRNYFCMDISTYQKFKVKNFFNFTLPSLL